MARAIMIQGTGSGVGKSLIVAGLCRIFRDFGIKVAPFKAQNMSLNSFITKEGGEIGRAQAFQAEAAGIDPCNDINPVLLKATSESGCQVIIDGKVYANMNADEYYAIKQKTWESVTAAYDRLSKKYDLIVIEGAGSPAEINLQEEEIVNMRVARYADAPVILVGDIDRGGVFASLYGTVELLKDCRDTACRAPTDADYIKAFIVNKFRGDINILRPGLRMIEAITGKLVIGVIDYLGDLGLHEEDVIPVERLIPRHRYNYKKPIKIVVLGLRYISNFTDFDPFMYEPDVELKYSLDDIDIKSADLIIIPGSKNAVSDLLFLRENRIEDAIKRAVKGGVPLIGICGGHQMIGQSILDPEHVESSMREVEGMGFLDTETTMDRTKTTHQVRARILSSKWSEALPHSCGCRWNNLKGYEIHMGHTTGDIGLFSVQRLQSMDHKGQHPAQGTQKTERNAMGSEVLDGSVKGNVWGTYIHGIFDNDGLRTDLLNSMRKEKGLPGQDAVSYQATREEAISNWAETLKRKVDICFILRQVGMECCMKKLPEDLV